MTLALSPLDFGWPVDCDAGGIEMAMVCTQVLSEDSGVASAGSLGSFELNAANLERCGDPRVTVGTP